MLPSPLPDDPRKWDGWNRYSSEDYYERLGLSFESSPTNEQIEDHSRQLLVWWQKKLPLKNQPSNPLAQMLRGGIDLAPRYIAQARAELLNPERRAELDAALRERQRHNALGEFHKFLDFALSDKVLTAEEEANLLKLAVALRLTTEDAVATIEAGLKATNAKREADLPVEAPPPPPPPPAAAPPTPVTVRQTQRLDTPRVRRARSSTPADEFRRMLRLSGLDEESMSDERRDTFVDMAENMGLDPGDAEDLVDEYLEGVANSSIPLAPRGGADAPEPAPVVKPKLRLTPSTVRHSPPGNHRAATATPLLRTASGVHTAASRSASSAPASGQADAPVIEVMDRADDIRRHPNYVNTLGAPMIYIPSSMFAMGSADDAAPVNEKPVTQVTLSGYYVSKFPVTNAEYEKFDPAHVSRRGSWANDRHPVIYVSSLDATKFCQWLSGRERKRYRLPTEAEWEYAAKGDMGLTYPWGDATDRGTLANFADANTTFAWRDARIDDGFAETSPVGSYPSGASPFKVEDLAGNVWEWCLDFYEPYKGGERANPRSSKETAQRVYRGGSWKSRFPSLKTTARSYNAPTYASNDVGFRIVCEGD